MNTWTINREKSFELSDLFHSFWNKNTKTEAKTLDKVIEIETMGIHPKYIEIIDEGEQIVVKGVNINNLNQRLCKAIDKSKYCRINMSNINYRAGKIIFYAQ